MHILFIEEGAGLDYTVSTAIVRALFSIPTPPDDVLFIFRVDDIALEENETLNLQLVPRTTLPSGGNVFFRNMISLTIIDSDCKTINWILVDRKITCSSLSAVAIFFTNDDYRAIESSGVMPVAVSKDGRIATPMTISINPLTVSQQRQSGRALPDGVPTLNPVSPPYAGNYIILSKCII